MIRKNVTIKYTASCSNDECSNTQEIQTKLVSEATFQLRGMGWLMQNVRLYDSSYGPKMVTLCPECTKEACHQQELRAGRILVDA